MNIPLPDLKKLAVIQDELDKLVEEKHGITEDTTDLRIIAFKVEFGEFLNEHKFFKFWKVDRTPNTRKERRRIKPGLESFDNHEGAYERVPYNPLLEEFVDGIHFLLSIGNKRKYIKHVHALEVTDLLGDCTFTNLALDIFDNPISSTGQWLDCVLKYLAFAHLSGITYEMIEEAYLKKNKINHERQANGY